MMFDAKQYWDTRLKAHYDLVGVGDISLSQNYNKWSYKVSGRILKNILKRYCANKKNQNVLDIGSGTGFVVNIWQSLSKNVAGIDISATAVSRLKITYPSFTFSEFDIGKEKINLPANSFSICSAASVLYHIVDDKALNLALKNIHSVLEKDGLFVFSENFIHHRVFNTTHQKCRTLEAYEAALKNNGFEIIARVPNYVLMNEPVDTEGKFYPRVWNLLTTLSRKSKLLDKIIWPVVYPLELFLTTVLKESPAQEFMICKAIK
ncbi:MAG: class I SAM-dependent methyltransferase [Ferruginibacter sp.]